MMTGRVVMSSCNFRNVTMDPLKDTEPTTTVKTVAISAAIDPEPCSVYSTTEISAAAPPPTPLKSATSCGMAVIWTRRAEITPIAEPTTIATRMIARLRTSIPLKKTTTVAMSAPSAPSRLPVRAVLGDDSPFRARMNKTAATR
jgi:hypothetical protein